MIKFNYNAPVNLIFRRVRSNENNIVFIVDEVQAGFARTVKCCSLTL